MLSRGETRLFHIHIHYLTSMISDVSSPTKLYERGAGLAEVPYLLVSADLLFSFNVNIENFVELLECSVQSWSKKIHLIDQ